ncbi:MAG: hypothetical protein WCA78_12250 [Rhizomicrobium sp.]
MLWTDPDGVGPATYFGCEAALKDITSSSTPSLRLAGSHGLNPRSINGSKSVRGQHAPRSIASKLRWQDTSHLRQRDLSIAAPGDFWRRMWGEKIHLII